MAHLADHRYSLLEFLPVEVTAQVSEDGRFKVKKVVFCTGLHCQMCGSWRSSYRNRLEEVQEKSAAQCWAKRFHLF